MHRDNIYFFHPTRDIGGAPYLLARIARYLIEHTSHRVYLIDYQDGFIRRRLEGLDYQFVEFKQGSRVAIEEPATIVQFLSHVPFINSRLILAETTKLFFWDMHPYNLVEQMAFSGVYKRMPAENAHRLSSLIEQTRCRKLARFVELGAASRGVVFMAERNKDYNQKLLGFSGQVGYLPIPIETSALAKSGGCLKNADVDQTIHIGWLSRLDTWKTRVLFRLLDDVDAYRRMHGSGSLHVHIIGDGPKQNEVQARCTGVNTSVVGRLEDSALSEYMLDHLHVGFAMGTSALEFAVRGVPAVLTPSGLSHDNSKKEKTYRWLFDSQGYDVAAEELTKPLGLQSFSDVVQRIRSSSVTYLGDRCQNYAVENHGIDNVGTLLAEYLSQCTLTYGDLVQSGIFECTPYERLLFGFKQTYKQLAQHL